MLPFGTAKDSLSPLMAVGPRALMAAKAETQAVWPCPWGHGVISPWAPVGFLLLCADSNIVIVVKYGELKTKRDLGEFMKLHIIMDFNVCEAKVFLNKDDAKAYVTGNCFDSRGGEAVWDIIKEEYLFDSAGFVYSTTDMEITSSLIDEVKEAVSNKFKMNSFPEIDHGRVQ